MSNNRQTFYRNFKPESVPFGNLQFWMENPRVSPWTTKMNQERGSVDDKDAIEFFVKGKGREEYKIQELAEDILNNDLADELLVNKIQPSEEYIVFEGNRRLGALHYIWNKYKHLPQVPNKFSKIDCKVFDNLNEDQMQELVKMYHGEGQKIKWSAYATALNNYHRYKSGTAIEKLGYKGKKTSINKARLDIEVIKLMNKHGVNTEDRFSYFLEYRKFLEKKEKSTSSKLLIRKIFPEDFDRNINKFEDYLVEIFKSDKKNHGAQNVREVLKEAPKTELGIQKLRAFASDGNFDILERWVRYSGASDNAETIVEGIADDLFKHQDLIETALDPDPSNIVKKTRMRGLLRKIYKSLEDLDPELFPKLDR